VQALDVLPYHVMGIPKYQQLGIPYPLEGVPAATKAQATDAKRTILTAFWKQRRSMTQ
jgi:pyruvate formate lyase activating enzyme